MGFEPGHSTTSLLDWYYLDTFYQNVNLLILPNNISQDSISMMKSVKISCRLRIVLNYEEDEDET